MLGEVPLPSSQSSIPSLWVTTTAWTLSRAPPVVLWLTVGRPEWDAVSLPSGRLRAGPSAAACAEECAVSWGGAGPPGTPSACT